MGHVTVRGAFAMLTGWVGLCRIQMDSDEFSFSSLGWKMYTYPTLVLTLPALFVATVVLAVLSTLSWQLSEPATGVWHRSTAVSKTAREWIAAGRISVPSHK